MIDSIIFLILGIFDSLAVMVLMFKLYRFPLKEYRTEIVLMAVWVSLTSYLIRMVLGITEIDIVVQIVLYILFMRLCIKTKLFYSAVISLTGLVGYIAIQMIIIYVLNVTGITAPSDVQENTGIGTYLIQVTSILFVYIIGYLLFAFNLGFSFIIRPPHEMSIKVQMTRLNKGIVLALILSIAVLCTTFYLLLNQKILMIIPILLATFVLLYILSHRRDTRVNDRIHIPKYSSKDQGN